MSLDSTGRINGDVPLVDATVAIEAVDDDATVLVSGFGSVGYPKAVPLALADSDRDLSLTVVSAGSVGKEIDVALIEADAIERRYAYQARRPIREAINEGRIEFNDRHVSSLGDEVQYGGLVDPDVAVIEAVAVGEDWLIPSTSIGQTPAFVESADALIVEVNVAQPRSLEQFHDVYRREVPPDRDPIPLSDPGERIGIPRVEFDPDTLLAVIESDAPDEPYTFRDPTDEDLAVATNLRSFLEEEVERSALYEDSVRLQFGVGSLGNALMQELGDADFGDRDLVYFGEVIQDGLLDLLEDDRLRSASATSLALSSEGQDRLFEHVERYAKSVVLRPADISNSPSLVDRFGVVSVNSALEIDLYGHVNSTHVDGSRMVNGIGGSGDFTRNAPLSVITLPSTVEGDISRVVPMVPHVDHTEQDVDVIVTEHGVADLRGTSPRERAALLVEECAHPDYRQQLREYLDRACDNGGHTPHDLDTTFSWEG
jgi:succinyl-CoA:acetate CoA-transferase